VSVIGTGGFSIVYKALDNSLQREVAIKEYFPGALALRDIEGTVHPHSRDASTFSKGIESFLNEGKLLAAFDHPALVRVYRCWEERGTAYLAMRLYTGITLRDAVIAGNWHADEASLHALLAPMCDALDLLHASRCYHRDVAPDNIMLVDGGAPVLLDFGAARKAIENTQVFTAILKPGYAPIEQYGDGDLKQGPWTDIYALAGVVHFTLAGAAPPTAISRMIRDAMPRPREAFVGRLPEHWLDAIEAALGVKPEQRPATISAFRELFRWDERVEVAAAAVIAVTSQIGSVAADEDRTVVLPRGAVDAQVAAIASQSTPTPERGALPKSAPQKATLTTTTGRKPATLWIGGGLAATLAVGALMWTLASKPATPALPPLALPKATLPEQTPPIKLDNDAMGDKKTSLSPEAASAVAPDALKPQPVAPGDPPVTLPVVKPPTAKPGAEKAVTRVPRKTDALPNDGEVRSPIRTGKRPERCSALVERFGLGELLSADDQRFIRESCK
jgi:serine/threonine protein kinase